MQKGNLPLGFAMALAQNEAALRAFGALPEAEKQTVIGKTHGVKSKREMQQLVAGLAENPNGIGVI